MKKIIKEAVRGVLSPVFPPPLMRWAAFEVSSFLKSLRFSRATARRYRGRSGLRVNVGCGSQPTGGWINLDVGTHPGVDFWDCRKGLPFADGTVLAIFTEHFVEHLEYPDEVHRFLAECHRCLADKGVLRVIVPDAGLYLRLYADGGWERMAEVRPLKAAEGCYQDYWLGDRYATRMQFINAIFRQGGEHRYAYDDETMARVLTSAGFTNVVRSGFGESSDPAMAPDTPERKNESLYFEASKT